MDIAIATAFMLKFSDTREEHRKNAISDLQVI